jgi:hypothetical protein
MFPTKIESTFHGTGTTAIWEFLEKEIPKTDAGLIKIIEWRPSLNYYKDSYVKLLSNVVEFIKRVNAEKRTTAAFAKRWVRNFFKNLKLINNTLLYKTTNIPVIITGSGPSLEAALPIIQEMKDNCLILAASSSVLALAQNGITADIVMSTDGGGWALQHIYPYFRNTERQSLFAVNLCAALPSQCSGMPFLLLNDGSYWQNIILRELGLPSVIIGQRGTVTASAIELALLLSSGNIYLAGMDLGIKDIKTHVKPYGFDHLLFSRANRFTPFYSENFLRSTLIQGGGSIDIYAAWFKNQLHIWQKRLFSLGQHEIFKSSMLPEKTSIKNKKNINEFLKPFHITEDPALFCKRGVSALFTALKDNNYSADLKAELTLLLFPEEEEVPLSKIETAITEAVQ